MTIFTDIRPLLLWERDQPAETPLQFEERSGELGRFIHIYPSDCPRCERTFGAVVTRGHKRVGEAWCLKCGEDL